MDPRFTGDQPRRESRLHQVQRAADAHAIPRQPASDGLSYTLSKATSNSNASAVGGGAATNPLDLSVDDGRPTRIGATTSSWDASYPFPLDFQLAGIYRYASALPYSVSSRFVINARPEPRNSRRGDDEKNFDLRVGKQFKLRAQHVDRCSGRCSTSSTRTISRPTRARLESTAFGQPARALPKRRQQFGFRVDF